MLRKTMIALMAAAALALLAPGSALARGGGFHGGGGVHGGNFGGFRGGGGGWHGGGIAAFRGAPIGAGAAFHRAGMVGGPHVGRGFHHRFGRRAFIAGAIAGAAFAPYGYYDDYYAYYAAPDQVYYDGGYVGTTCALVRQPVQTLYGWGYRTVQVCQ